MWLGDTTLVGVSWGAIVLLTRGEEGEADEEQGVWEEIDDELIRTARRLVLRDALARALGGGLLTDEDLAWAAQRAEVVREVGYVAPSGQV